jgi:hypothetical protein
MHARTNLTPSAARAAVAIARRNYEHAKDAVSRAEAARRLAAAAALALAIDRSVEL